MWHERRPEGVHKRHEFSGTSKGVCIYFRVEKFLNLKLWKREKILVREE